MRKYFVFPILIIAMFSTACGAFSLLPQVGSSDSFQVTPDSSNTATATIGADGGTIRATAADGTTYELVVPPEALDFDETISMTPIGAVEGLPLSGGLSGAVTLEPAGIIFYEPATLIITPATPLSGELTLGFAYDGAGEEFHLQRASGETSTTGFLPDSAFMFNAMSALPTNPSTPTLKLSVLSTRGYGAGSGTAKDVTNRQKATPRPTDSMDHIDELMVDDFFIASPKFIEEMSNAFNTGILPLLNAAKTDPTLANKALHMFDRWYAYVDEYDLRSELGDELAIGKAVIGDIIDKAAENSAERCYTEKRPEEAFALQRWIRYARKFLPNTSQIAEMQTHISKCLTFKVKFHTLITEEGGDYGYSYELNSEPTLRATKSIVPQAVRRLSTQTDIGSVSADAVSNLREKAPSLMQHRTLSVYPLLRSAAPVRRSISRSDMIRASRSNKQPFHAPLRIPFTGRRLPGRRISARCTPRSKKA